MTLLAVSCAAAPAPRVDLQERVEVASAPPVTLRLVLQPEHTAAASRYMSAAIATVKMCVNWLGPFGGGPITLVDQDWRGSPAAGGQETLLPRVHWWVTTTSMAPELSAARAVSGRFWKTAMDPRDIPSWFVDGLAEFTARRAAASLFAAENNPPGYAFLELRYFGGFVPRFVRIRLSAENDGAPVSAYRAHPAVPVVPRPGTVDDREALAGKTLLALGTLERWLGRPVLDDIVAEFARTAHGQATTIADFQRTASEVSGQDLSWFFDETFRSSGRFDYGVETLTSESEAGDVFITTVAVRRYGDARFTGVSAPPVDGFESGHGIAVRVTFADGHWRADHWDGRGQDKTFRYRSPARAVSARVDPERTLLLDLTQTNNGKAMAPVSREAAQRWAARYVIWLQDLLLSYASLV